jgi:hypothetical protein
MAPACLTTLKSNLAKQVLHSRFFFKQLIKRGFKLLLAV